jgi:hypothetical protein
MKNVSLWMAVVAVLALGGCNLTVGECWYKADGENGAGSGAGAGDGNIIPSGAGGYGETPPKEPQGVGPKPPVCNEIGSYSSSLFKFKVDVADDGKGVAGGWQVASSTVQFVDGRPEPPTAWTCDLVIGMPIRSQVYKTISAEYAAEMTAEVVTFTSSDVMHRKPMWLKSLYCIKLAEAMEKMFREGYGLGATVTGQ